MTSGLSLGLPIDIPWQRICVSEDMLDPKICDLTNPPKWNSSLAVFKFTPDDDNQNNEHHDVVYLKVVATITGYQPRDQEIEGTLDWDNLTIEQIEEVEDLLNEYHPCTGAILQVSVAPKDTSITDPKEFPYILDFEPKKRELYETATDTNEKMSRSLETLNIAKSNSTTQSTEVLDIDMGSSYGGGTNFQYAGTGGGMNFNYATQGQWGTKDIGSNESSVVRTTDNSREKRETTSYTTNLTQMYHLLDAYHKGTNRAMFFVQPRPHTLEEPSGFVRGPRPVEGIQEFFIIVAKPKEQEDIAVSIRLDTAHLTQIDIMEYDYKTDTEELSVSANAPSSNTSGIQRDGSATLGISYGPFGSGTRNYDCYTKTNEQTLTYTPPWADYIIESYDEVFTHNYGSRTIQITGGGGSLIAKVYATSRACFDDGGDVCLDCPDTIHKRNANASLALSINLRSKDKIIKVGTEQVLLVTTRGLCCGLTPSDDQIVTGPYLGPGILGAVTVKDIVGKYGDSYDISILHPFLETKSVDVVQPRGSVEKKGFSLNMAKTEVEPKLMTSKQANRLSALLNHQLKKTVRKETEVKPLILHDYFLDQLDKRLRKYPSVRKMKESPATEVLNKFLPQEKVSLVNNQFKRRDEDIITKNRLARINSKELSNLTGMNLEISSMVRLEALGIKLNKDKITDLMGTRSRRRGKRSFDRI